MLMRRVKFWLILDFLFDFFNSVILNYILNYYNNFLFLYLLYLWYDIIYVKYVTYIIYVKISNLIRMYYLYILYLLWLLFSIDPTFVNLNVSLDIFVTPNGLDGIQINLHKMYHKMWLVVNINISSKFHYEISRLCGWVTRYFIDWI